jgi:hypothetical protein
VVGLRGGVGGEAGEEEGRGGGGKEEEGEEKERVEEEGMCMGGEMGGLGRNAGSPGFFLLLLLQFSCICLLFLLIHVLVL